MPLADTDEEEVQAPQPPPVTTADGASPLVPSAPLDAEPAAAPIVYAKPVALPPEPARPAVPPALPKFRRQTAMERLRDYETATARYEAGEAEKQRKHQAGVERFNATQMYEAQKSERGQINAETQQTLQRKRIVTERDPATGEVQPQRDEAGNVLYRPGKGPVRYDQQGRAIQTEYEESGPKVVALDKDAKIGPHKERPTEIYRQNKHAPWEYVGTVEEALQSKDEKIQIAGRDAKLGLDKRLHSEVAHELGEEVATRALAVQTRMQDFTGKAVTLKTLNDQLATFDTDNPGVNETQGGLFGLGTSPSPTAVALREKKAGIQKQIEDLQAQGYSTNTKPEIIREFAKPEMDALHDARGLNDSWLAPKEPGDFDRLIQNRVATLAEAGVDPSTDRVLQSLEKKKAALGIGQPPKAKAPDDEALRADPLYGPIVAERDQLTADRQNAESTLGQARTEYETRLQPFRDDLEKAEAQIAPMQDQADRLQARLEGLVGMPATVEGEDPDVHRQQLMLLVSQIKDPKTKVRAQTVLNSLEPLYGEITSRRAQIQPVADAHDQLQAEAEQSLAQQQQELQVGLTDRETALRGKIETAEAVQAIRESHQALSLLNSTLLYPSSPAFAQEVAAAKDEAQKKRLAENSSGLLFGQTLGASNFERGIISGAASTIGSSIKGLTQFLENVSDRITIHDPQVPNNYKDEGARALADLFLKVPGVLAPDANTADSLSYKAGSFVGGIGVVIGEAIVSPYLLVTQFFGQGYNGQADAAELYFEQQALANPGAPRDLAQEKIATEKAAVLGGAVNSILAIPFNVYGKVVTSVFGSTKSNVISNVLKKSYESGGLAAVAQDLQVLKAGIAKSATPEAFKATAQQSLDQVIKEITRTPLQRAATVLKESAIGATIFGGVQAAQNAVSKTYNPKTGLFENVAMAAVEGAALSAFFGVISQASKAKRAAEARGQLEATLGGNKRGGAPEPGAPPAGLGGGPEPGAPPSPEAARTEINSLVASERVAPEQVAVTQNALRGLVKIAQGQPMEALTAVERSAVESETPDGISRVEIVNGKPVITDSTLDRVRQIAPVTAQLLPRSEEQQRQTIINEPETKGSEAIERKAETVSTELPTFSVEVQDARGQTTETQVQAPDEKAARAQVAARIAPGQGLVRDVTQITSPAPAEASAYVPPEKFESHVLEQISREAGRPLKEAESVEVRKLVKVAAPAYERWSKAFATINATLQSRESAGVSFSPQTKGLNIMIPDLARHAALYADSKSGNALVLHEAAHAVTTASGAKVVQLFKSAPAALQAAMKEAYRAPGATDYNFAHELWAYALAGKVELTAGRKIKLSGKFLPEQANRDFIVKYKRAFAEVLRFTRDIEGYLRKRGVAEDEISQWKELETLFVSKIRSVDAGEKPPEKEVTDDKLPSNTPRGSGARAPPASPRAPEPARSEASVKVPDAAPPVRPDRGRAADSPKSVDRAPESATGTELGQPESKALADKLKIPLTAVGHASKVTSNGRTVNVAYVAQEAAAARTSHDSQGRPTEGYDQSLQPRDRGLAAYRKQAQNIARGLDFSQAAFFPETKVAATTPDLGAPIMTRGGDTLIGNGREIGIKLAYEQGHAEKYKLDFIRNARAFGIDPATVRDMKEPILKRVILDELPKDDLVRFSQESNEAAAMGTNAIEMAGRDATRLTPELLSLFDPNYALDAGKNQAFLRAYMRDVVKGGGAANEANLTGSELERRVRAAVFAYAYGTDVTGRAALERLAGDETDPGGKTITNALLTVAPIVARMKTDIATGDLFPLDISAAISRAAQDISEALRNKPVKQSTATALTDMRNQAGLIESNPLETAVTNFFLDNRLSRQSIEQGLSNYVEAVFKLGNPKNAELFGERTVPKPLELFTRATAPDALAGGLNAQAIIESAPTYQRIEGPALVDENGKILVRGHIGQTHASLMREAAGSPNFEQVLDAMVNDAQHVFVDTNGKVLSREEAAPVAVAARQAPEGTTKLQSQNLSLDLSSQGTLPGLSGITLPSIEAMSESYSGDKIMDGKVRKPVEINETLNVAVSVAGPMGARVVKLVELIPAKVFAGKKTTYAEKIGPDNGASARVDPFGFYYGIQVAHGGNKYVLGSETKLSEKGLNEIQQRSTAPVGAHIVGNEEPGAVASSPGGQAIEGQGPAEVRTEVGGGELAEEKAVAPQLQPGEEQGSLPTGETKTEVQLASERTARDLELLNLQRQQDVRIGASRRLVAGDLTQPEADMFAAAKQGELFAQTVARLPERMQDAVSGLLNGETLAEGAAALGVSREGVGRLAKEAIRRLRAELGEPAVAANLAKQAVTLEGKQPKEYGKSSTQVTLSKVEAQPFTQLAESIPDADLYLGEEGKGDSYGPNYGREDQPHVTALYGITQGDPGPTAKAILAESSGVIRATAGKLSLFHSKDYDVLKVDIESSDLREIENHLRESVPFKSDFPDYKPHMTIAYLKKGKGAKYVGDARFEGTPLSFSVVDFRSKDGRKYQIDLSKGARTAIGAKLEILDNAISMELRAQETDDPLKELMAMIDTDVLGNLYRKAQKEDDLAKYWEVSGQFETGRPDLALGAEGPSIRAAHQYHTDTFQKETIEGWDKIADKHLADPKWARDFSQGIVRRYLSGDNLTAWETRAAMRLIAADSHALGTPEEKLGHATRAFAYARLRSKAGAELGSGRDPFKTPEERGREFLSKAMFRLKPEVEAQIEAEPNPAKREEKLSAAMKERIDQLEKAFSHLAGRGITVDDIFNGSWELHGKGKKLIEKELSSYDARQQQALKLAQTGTRSATAIAKATGLSVADVERINDEFIDQLEKSLMAKVAGGLSLENIDLQDATLLAQTPETPAPANAAAKTPEEIRAEVRRIIKGMGFVASKDLGRFKVAKKKRPKLFVPPKPYAGPVPSEEPVPFEQRKQESLIEEPPVRPPNENAPVPYPEGQTPPYPGRVLGQTGLPLQAETPLPPSPTEPMDDKTRRTFFPETPKAPNESAPVPYPEGQTAPYTGRVLGQTGLPLYQEMMITKGADMGSFDDLAKIGRIAQSLDAKPFDMVYEAWINNIFSGLGTHTANVSGNTLSTVMDFTLQRGMESLLNVIYRDADAPTLGEFKYIAQGVLPGLAAGIRRGVRAWDAESSMFSNDVMNEQIEILEALDKSGGVPPAIPGTTGRVIRIPVRALLFEDEVFKSVIGQMEVMGQAYRIAAKQEGLKGEALTARMNELISTPGSKAWARAVEKAIYLTYQEPTGLTTLFRDQGKSAALGKMAAKAGAEGRHRTQQVLKTEELVVRNLYRVAGFFFPVIRTTYNIFKIGVSTANVLPTFTTIPYRLGRAGFYKWKDGKPFVESYPKAKQIHDLAQQMIAWVTFGTLWALTTGDENDDDKPILLTGSMPYTQAKRGQRELNERSYGGTYILRIGGRNGVYIPYGRIEPIATVLGTVVDTITQIKKVKHGQGLAETGDALLGYFLAQAQSKTFLSGFSDLTKALEGSTSFTDVPKKLFLQALVPNLIRQPLRALDDWQRDNKTAPALYQTLPVGAMAEKKTNVYGQPVAKGGNWFTRIFMAAGVKPDAQLERADRFLQNWNREHPTETWAPSVPLSTYHDADGKKHDMTGPEKTKFLEVSGRRAAERLRSEITESQINHPTPDDLKTIQEIFEQSRRRTKEEMFPKHRVNQVRAAYKKAA